MVSPSPPLPPYPPRSRPIALVGLMGAGKSVVAAALAARLGRRAMDLDQELEAEAGCSVAEYFRRHGEPAFRARERELLERAACGASSVVACGGGVVVDPANRALLRDHFRVVWLDVSPAVAARRIGDPASRPVLENEASDGAVAQRLQDLLAVRAPLYAEVAGVRVVADDGPPDEIAARVLEALAQVSS